MSNIVERLRSFANVFYEYAADNGAFLREAAAEITRLRAENEKLGARAVLIPESVQKIIDDYPAVCAERDRMREALKDALVWLGDPHGGRPVMSVDSIRNIADSRAALEGVTKKEGEGNE